MVIARYVYSIPALVFANANKRVNILEGVLKPDWVVYCYADRNVLRKRLKDRSEGGVSLAEHELDLERYDRLCQRYDELFENMDNVIRVNTSKKSVKESVDEILSKLKNI